jgi:hypothetical protein
LQGQWDRCGARRQDAGVTVSFGQKQLQSA